MFAIEIGCGQSIPGCKHYDLVTSVTVEGIAQYEKSFHTLLIECSKRSVKVAFGAGIQHDNSLIDLARGVLHTTAIPFGRWVVWIYE
jgi:hypothetical protein